MVPTPPRSRLSAPGRITLLYVLLGAAWIVLTDAALPRLGMPPGGVLGAGTLKGLLFVAVTAVILHFLIRREVMRTRATAARLEALLQAAPLGVATLDADGRILQWNDAAAAITGHTAEDASGRPIADLGFHLTAAAAADAPSDVLVPRPAGQPVPLRLFSRAAGGTGERIVLFYDRSRMLDAEAAERQLQKLAAVGRLAGGVAHDFNNLLTAVLGHAVLLADTLPADSPLQQNVDEIRRAATRGAGVTRQLLVVSGRNVTRPRTIDLGAMLREMVALSARAGGDDIRIDYRLADGLWPVLCDPVQLQQAILNLVANAREAMPDGGSLVFETANRSIDDAVARTLALPAGDYAVLAVTDSGRGMDDDTRRHLFEPFFTTKHQRAGLGLATVYGVLQQCDGHIRVTSQPGAGTRFELIFPRAAAHEEPAPARDDQHTGVAPARLLLVEDDEMVRLLISRVLTRAGHSVFTATDAQEALRFVRSSDPVDLVIADVIMPGMDGIRLSRIIRDEWPGVPILITSGYTGGSLIDESQLDDDMHFISKPFRPEELIARIRQLLLASAGRS